MQIIATILEAAEYLGCSDRTIKRMIKRDEMPKPLQVKKDKYTKRYWTSEQLEVVRKLIEKRKKYSPKKD
jgi:predicted DNA-binding transcriptional regulator AlpA